MPVILRSLLGFYESAIVLVAGFPLDLDGTSFLPFYFTFDFFKELF